MTLYDLDNQFEAIDFWFNLLYPIMWPQWYTDWRRQRDEEDAEKRRRNP